MFVIWGSYKFKKVFGTEKENCSYCKDAVFTYIRVMTWFNLFFIPLFPYHIAYIRVCNSCGYTEKLTKQQFFYGPRDTSTPSAAAAHTDVFDGQNTADNQASVPLLKEVRAREIVIKRKKKFFAALAKINIHVDGAVVAVLKNGGTARFTVDSESHNMFATMGGGDYIKRSPVILLESSYEDRVFLLAAGAKLKLFPEENNTDN